MQRLQQSVMLPGSHPSGDRQREGGELLSGDVYRMHSGGRRSRGSRFQRFAETSGGDRRPRLSPERRLAL